MFSRLSLPTRRPVTRLFVWARSSRRSPQPSAGLRQTAADPGAAEAAAPTPVGLETASEEAFMAN